MKTFEEVVEGWVFATAELLRLRWETARPLARTTKHHEVLEKILVKYLDELTVVRRRQRVEGLEAPAALTDLVIQTGHADRYAGDLRHNRFQVMGSLTPPGTYYVVDHARSDLLLRVGGFASEIRRFDSIEDAEKTTDALALSAPLDQPPPRRGLQENDMAKPVRKTNDTKPKAKAAPAKAAAPSNGGAQTRSRLDQAAKITLLKKENPKRAGTAAYAAYAKYKDGMTVAAFLAAGGRAIDLGYDQKAGNIRVG